MKKEKQEVRNFFERALRIKIEEALENFLEVNQASRKFVSTDVEQLTAEETELGLDDLLAELADSTQSLEEDVRDYVDENYDFDYFVVKFDRLLDLEKIRTDLQEELVLRLSNTEPYGYVSSRYWYSRVRQVDSINLLSRFVDSDLEVFVTDYAENWASEKEV